jgi:hypothetical protein
MITTTTPRYYRGYNIRQTDDNTWIISWGDDLDTAATLQDAEAVVDHWVEGSVR